MNLWHVVSMLLAVAASDSPNSFDPWAQSATYELVYRVDASSLLTGAGDARLWIPLPAQTPHQRLHREKVKSPWSYRIARDDYGNRMIYVEPKGSVDHEAIVEVHSVVERYPSAASVLVGEGAEGRNDPKRFLAPSRKIPIDGVVKNLANRLARRRDSESVRIHAFYDYVVSNLKYSKTGVGWGQGDAVRACNVRSGNCTDFHSLFIGMARSQGIPARFVIGFPLDATKTEGFVQSYHCWAQVYDSDKGWIPLDASEAHRSGRGRDYLGKLPSDRIAFTMGRDLALAPAQSAEPLNFFVYPYGEVDGESVSGIPWTVHFRRMGVTPVSDPR